MKTAAFRKHVLTGQTYMGRPAADLPGYASEFFHIGRYKTGSFAVYHLPSGLGVHILNRPTLRDTKTVVAAVEAAFDWSGKDIHEIAEKNGMLPRDFIASVTATAIGAVPVR